MAAGAAHQPLRITASTVASTPARKIIATMSGRIITA
jgi:hypothetical protein